jgi:hypothetical protein
VKENPLTPFSQGTVGLLRRLFGPAASELGEALADRVRIYRAKNLKRIIESAEAKLGNEKVEELPLRFSIPLIEKASQEDDAVLSEMWANLLASAAKEVRDDHYLMLRVLSALTPTSVELLDYIVGDFWEEEDWYNELAWEHDWLHDLEDYTKANVEPFFHETGKKHKDPGELASKFFEFPHRKPFWVFRVEIPYVPKFLKKEIDEGRPIEEAGSIIAPISVEGPSLQILEREQLVVRRKHELKLEYCVLEFSYVAATPLAVDLVATCKPKQTQNAP